MKNTLSENERNRLDEQIKDLEQRTHTQIVLAFIQRSDSYEELPWKAFAFGASFTSFLVFLQDQLFSGWYSGVTVFIAAAGILAGGVVMALLTILLPGFARRFLSRSRAEVEVRQYADSLFLSRELFATSKRNGILLLVSLFERKVVILPDKGLSARLSKDNLQSIISAMTPLLKRREIRQSFEVGLERMAKHLETDGSGKNENELSDEIIEENGV